MKKLTPTSYHGSAASPFHHLALCAFSHCIPCLAVFMRMTRFYYLKLDATYANEVSDGGISAHTAVCCYEYNL